MVKVLLKDSRAIHLLVFDTLIQKFSVVSSVYAPAQTHDKDNFWSHLVYLNSIIDYLWCLVGDFNELEYPDDKAGGIPARRSRCNCFPSFLSSISASTIEYQGRIFTWKKHVHGHLIYERLDRAVDRLDWLGLYPEVVITHGPFLCSDHCYISLNTQCFSHNIKGHSSSITLTSPNMIK